MTITRHKRTTHIENDTVMDDSDRSAMQLGYAVIKYYPQLIDVLNGCINKSKEECKKVMHKKTVIFDVDGVLFEYDEWHGLEHYGKPIQENIDICNAFHQSDEYDVCIWTTRTNPYVQGYPQEQLIKALEDVLTQTGVKYHKILREPKPLFDVMIDDRSYNPDNENRRNIIREVTTVYFDKYQKLLLLKS
jgi:hypothetical protein